MFRYGRLFFIVYNVFPTRSSNNFLKRYIIEVNVARIRKNKYKKSSTAD